MKKILHRIKRHARSLHPRNQNSLAAKLLILFFGGSLFVGAIGLFLIYFIFLHSLPSIEELSNRELAESTVFYDREGKELYKLYKNEKRTYVPYENISKNIKDAIVSIEDKSFFTNPGIDIFGIIRAGVNYGLGRTTQIKGTSTLSQQLIRNTLISNERSVGRKIKEIYLSYQLNNAYSKEKILELYLNTISFGNNAFGIEEASHTYFGKSAKDVGLLGATILTSLPKGPTYYSPYSHRDRLMGYVYIYRDDVPEEKTTLDSAETRKKYQNLYKTFKTYLSGLTFEERGGNISICNVHEEFMKPGLFNVDRDKCIEMSKESENLMRFVNGIIIKDTQPIATNGTGSGQKEVYTILEYEAGRKDLVATQMLEDGKIKPEEFQKVVYDGLEFEFKRYAENIRYPYFVFYVKEYIEEKYGKDIDVTNGLKVYTTIDPKLQDKAEELVQKQVKINSTNHGATSAALVSMDNRSGEILSMVGGPDYFDEKNGGNNNMITSRRQPGSSFKPLVYALAISKNPIGPETPIYDVDTKFGEWDPDNYDLQFEGRMMVKTALDHSRNIPAIKMYFLAGEEKEIIKFGQNIGIKSLKENMDYGAPLSIGTAEVKPIEIMQAYSVLANEGKLRQITPILRIEDSEGNVIEEQKNEIEAKEVFSAGASYITSKILSDSNARPSWGKRLDLKGRPAAAKTGTSNKDVSKGKEKKILPRDLWTAGYTPQITTVVWAGNVDGRETKGSCDGINCAGPIWHDYMEFAHTKLPKEEFKRPKEGTYDITISRLSGKKATESLPDSLKVTTVVAVDPKNLEVDTPPKSVQIDTLCNGAVTDKTPEEAIGNVYIQTSAPIIDGYKKDWLKTIPGFGTLGYIENSESGTGQTVEILPTPCERPEGEGSIEINIRIVGATGSINAGRKLVEVSYIGDRAVRSIRIRQGDELKYETTYNSGTKTTGIQRAAIEINKSGDPLIAEIIDAFGFTYTKEQAISIIETNSAPKITMINPIEGDSDISIYENSFFNLRFKTDISTDTREITVSIDGQVKTTYTQGDAFTVPINKDGDITPGKHTLSIQVTDGLFRKTIKSLEFLVLKR